MDRRRFLWLTGTAGAAMLAPSSERSPGEAVEEVRPGLESWKATACLMCPGGCGLRVRSVDGFPVTVSGNPNHPLNAGGVCTEGLAALELLDHPDRLLEPLRRNGPKPSAALVPASWDEALGQVSRAIAELRARGRPEKLAFVTGRTGNTMEALIRRFMGACGSASLFVDEPDDGYAEVFEAMHGVRARPAFDFGDADLVLSFGADLLGDWVSPLQFQRAHAGFRSDSRRGRLVVADVRLSRTAARADEWIPVNPGTFGALALGIAYVLVREKLYDLDFVAERLFGFGDLRDPDGTERVGFERLVTRDYSPEVVSRLTGAPVEKILALGKMFAESAAPLAVFDESLIAAPGGLYAAMAVHSLNLLKGRINRPGGIYLQPPLPLEPLGAGPQPPEPRRLHELVRSGDLPEVLLLYCSNPVFSSPLGRQLEAALERIPLVVSFSPFLDETCRVADVVLPDTIFLERWDDRAFPATSPAAGWGIAQPSVPPRGSSRASGDVVLELARRIGSPVAEACPWQSFEELLRHRAGGLFQAHAGIVCREPFQQGLVSEMERRGWWSSDIAEFDAFWAALLDAGAWTDPHFQVRNLDEYSGHPDRKIDLYSRTIADRFGPSKEARVDLECLPHYHGGEASAPMTYPMTLHLYRLGKRGGGTNCIVPWVLDGAGEAEGIPWSAWAEIHPADARALGVRNLDWVTVESPAGRARLRAVVDARAGRGVVSIPTGLGHRAMGRWAAERGVNPIALLAGECDPLTGLPYRTTRVRVTRA